MGKKGEETRALIREKALLLFAQKGFDSVTMKDICLATGLSRGGLYRHYESTRQIFSEILELMLDAQRQEFSEKMRGGIAARDILSGILERYRNEMLDGSGALSLAILEFYRQRRPGGGENALYRQYLDSRAMWSDFIAYGVRRGEFRDIDAGEVIDILLFSYQGVRMLSPVLPVGSETPERIIGHIQRLLLKEE